MGRRRNNRKGKRVDRDGDKKSRDPLAVLPAEAALHMFHFVQGLITLHADRSITWDEATTAAKQLLRLSHVSKGWRKVLNRHGDACWWAPLCHRLRCAQPRFFVPLPPMAAVGKATTRARGGGGDGKARFLDWTRVARRRQMGQVAGRYAPVRIDEAVRRFDVWHALLLFANTCYGVRCSLRIADLTKAKGHVIRELGEGHFLGAWFRPMPDQGSVRALALLVDGEATVSRIWLEEYDLVTGCQLARTVLQHEPTRYSDMRLLRPLLSASGRWLVVRVSWHTASMWDLSEVLENNYAASAGDCKPQGNEEEGTEKPKQPQGWPAVATLEAGMLAFHPTLDLLAVLVPQHSPTSTYEVIVYRLLPNNGKSSKQPRVHPVAKGFVPRIETMTFNSDVLVMTDSAFHIFFLRLPQHSDCFQERIISGSNQLLQEEAPKMEMIGSGYPMSFDDYDPCVAMDERRLYTNLKSSRENDGITIFDVDAFVAIMLLEHDKRQKQTRAAWCAAERVDCSRAVVARLDAFWSNAHRTREQTIDAPAGWELYVEHRWVVARDSSGLFHLFHFAK